MCYSLIAHNAYCWAPHRQMFDYLCSSGATEESRLPFDSSSCQSPALIRADHSQLCLSGHRQKLTCPLLQTILGLYCCGGTTSAALERPLRCIWFPIGSVSCLFRLSSRNLHLLSGSRCCTDPQHQFRCHSFMPSWSLSSTFLLVFGCFFDLLLDHR